MECSRSKNCLCVQAEFRDQLACEYLFINEQFGTYFLMSEHAQTSVPMWFTVAFVAISIFFSFFKGSDKSSELALAAAGVGAGAANALEADVSKVVEDANRLAADSTETISGLAVSYTHLTLPTKA